MPGFHFLPGRSAGLLVALVVTGLSLAACSGGNSPPPTVPPRAAVNATITVNWAASPEFEVAQAGGGYRVYFSDSPFTTSNDPGVMVIDNIPNNVTSQDIPVTLSGSWYVRVQAFSARNTTGSALSQQITINVPAP